MTNLNETQTNMQELEENLENDTSPMHQTVFSVDRNSTKLKREKITILNVWKDERKKNRIDRRFVAIFLGVIIFAILIFLGTYLFLDAFNVIEVQEWTLRLVVISIFGVVAGMFTIIIKHMFPEDSDKDFFAFMTSIYARKNKENEDLELL